MTQDPSSPREELANCLSHGLGLLLAILLTPVLIRGALLRGGPADAMGSAVFGASMILLYLASTLYHGAPAGPLRDRLRQLDHAAIYLLIAGTYTPFTLGVLGGAGGWALLVLVWGVAALGIGQKLLTGIRAPRLSTAIYVIMGWLVLIALRPLMSNMPLAGVLLLLAGGLFYTTGTPLASTSRIPYAHLVWHLFVLAGTACHFFAVLWFAV